MSNRSVVVRGEELLLLPQRAVYWPGQKALILSDLHLGKAGHFRRHGIAISRRVHLHDLQNLESLIQSYQPRHIYFLGDLFHSYLNAEWNDFLMLMHTHPSIGYTLIEGNHDILQDYPAELNVTFRLEVGPFSFTHIREESTLYNISGHIHPGVTIRDKARQSMTLPCFLFTPRHAILPAYGQFTGIKKIRPSKEDKVFVVADQQVMELM